jgi:hypothetical protein
MHSKDDLNALTKAYEQALVDYEAAAAPLSRHALAGSKPSAAELERETGAQRALEFARQQFLEALNRL